VLYCVPLTRTLVRGDCAWHDSTQRLWQFTQSQVAGSVSHILGAHIEMTNAPRICYPSGTSWQPKEHVLQMNLDHLRQLNEALQSQDPNAPVPQVLDDFIVWPTSPVPLTVGGRFGSHGMVVLNPGVTQRQQLNDTVTIALSHIPMFRSPHDFQVIIQVTATSASLFPLPFGLVTAVPPANFNFPLNDLIEGRLKDFYLDVYVITSLFNPFAFSRQYVMVI
jgi:hypothetical protein